MSQYDETDVASFAFKRHTVTLIVTNADHAWREIRVAAVPEPATMVLRVTGSSLVGVLSFHKQNEK